MLEVLMDVLPAQGLEDILFAESKHQSTSKLQTSSEQTQLQASLTKTEQRSISKLGMQPYEPPTKTEPQSECKLSVSSGQISQYESLTKATFRIGSGQGVSLNSTTPQFILQVSAEPQSENKREWNEQQDSEFDTHSTPVLIPGLLMRTPNPAVLDSKPKAESSEKDPTINMSPGDITLYKYTVPVTRPGGTLTLALPIYYRQGDQKYASNASVFGEIIAYGSDLAEEYDQSLVNILSEIRMTIPKKQDDGCPLILDELPQSKFLLHQGQNAGYAVFSDLPIRTDALTGVYTVRLTVIYRNSDIWENEKELVALIQIAVLEDPHWR